MRRFIIIFPHRQPRQPNNKTSHINKSTEWLHLHPIPCCIFNKKRSLSRSWNLPPFMWHKISLHHSQRPRQYCKRYPVHTPPTQFLHTWFFQISKPHFKIRLCMAFPLLNVKTPYFGEYNMTPLHNFQVFWKYPCLTLWRIIIGRPTSGNKCA
jgi:hypothetical protein